MELNELITKAHYYAHAAELATQANSPHIAKLELMKLCELLNAQPELEASGSQRSYPEGAPNRIQHPE